MSISYAVFCLKKISEDERAAAHRCQAPCVPGQPPRRREQVGCDESRGRQLTARYHHGVEDARVGRRDRAFDPGADRGLHTSAVRRHQYDLVSLAGLVAPEATLFPYTALFRSSAARQPDTRA